MAPGYTKPPIKYKILSCTSEGLLELSISHRLGSQNLRLEGADNVILTGMSTGGLAVNSWSNYLEDCVVDHSKVYTISESGILNNFKTIYGQSTI